MEGLEGLAASTSQAGEAGESEKIDSFDATSMAAGVFYSDGFSRICEPHQVHDLPCFPVKASKRIGTK